MRLPLFMTLVTGSACFIRAAGPGARPSDIVTRSDRLLSAGRSELSPEKLSSLRTHEDEERMFIIPKDVQILQPLKEHYKLDAFGGYLDFGVKASSLFKLLNLHKALEEPVNNALVGFKLAHLEKYMDFLKNNNGEDPETLETLSTCLAENELPEDYEAQLLNIKQKTNSEVDWLQHGMDPAQFFEYRKLREDGLKLFENRYFKRWMDYVDAFNNVYHDGKPLIQHLNERGYGDITLVNMVYYGTRRPKDGSTRKRVLDLLIESWLSNSRDPAEVFKLLGLMEAESKAIYFTSPRFEKWLHYLEHWNAEKKLEPPVSYLPALKLAVGSKYSENDLVKMLLKEKRSEMTELLARNFIKHLEELNKISGRDKADRDNADKQLSDLLSYVSRKKRKARKSRF